MTVIAWDGRVLCADGRISADDTLIADNFKKLFEIVIPGLGKCVIGLSGDCGLIGPYLEHLKLKGLKKFDAYEAGGDRDSKVRGICITPKGNCIEFGHDGGWYEINSPTAIGSGSLIAQHYLVKGESALTAVTEACKTELGCGGRLLTYDSKKKEWTEYDA